MSRTGRPRSRHSLRPRPAPPPAVTPARRLDHSAPTITLGYYAHFLPEAGGRKPAARDAAPSTACPGSGETGPPAGTPRILPGAADR